MSETSRKALLDTDFLFKAHLSQNSSRDPLADLIINFEDYEFFCHAKILDELGIHGFEPNPVPWLNKNIGIGKVKKYSDGDILDELEIMYGKDAPKAYFDLLKIGCDAFDPAFFGKHYQKIVDLPDDVTKEKFLSTLEECDSEIPNRSSMGEKKSFVLAQMMQMKHPGKVVVFCSDDGKARQHLTYVGSGLKGLSILAVFQKMMSDGVEKDTAKQYYDSLCSFYSLRNQTGMKVWKHATSEKINVPFEKVFDDIYSGKFEIKWNGDLRYNSDSEDE